MKPTDPFGPCALVACGLCLILWCMLTIRNLKNENGSYVIGCGLMSLAFIVEFIQYVLRFFVYNESTNLVMGFLFIKMLIFAFAALIFTYNYKAVKKDD